MKYMPCAFTESGVAMLSGVLRSSIAIDVNIRIMRAFVSMRKALASVAPVIARVSEIERLQLEEKTLRLADQQRNEERFDAIFKAMDGGDFPPQKLFFSAAFCLRSMPEGRQCVDCRKITLLLRRIGKCNGMKSRKYQRWPDVSCISKRGFWYNSKRR